MSAISGKKGRVRFASATATNSTNEAATLAAGGVNLTINSTAKSVWDPNSTKPRVYSSTSTGTALARDLYEVDYGLGRVRFNPAKSTALTYKVDVDYLSLSYLTGARAYGIEVETKMLDVTCFSTSTADTVWRTFRPGLSGASVSLGRLVSTGDTGPLMYDRLNGVQSLVVELFPDFSTGARYVAITNVARNSVQSNIDGVVEELVNLPVTGPVYYTS